MRAILILIFFVALNACGDDPVLENPEELITTLKMKFTAPDQSISTLEFIDVDGEGGANPIINIDPLEISTSYNVTIELLNESISPVENITTEVQTEDEDHQFYFTVTPLSLFTAIDYSDMDANGNPTGIQSTFTTSGTPGTGTMVVVLRHLPDKSVPYILGNQIPAGIGGETDIEVSFNITIE